MQSEPETANTTNHSSAWHWFAWTFAILFIAYPLSIGPAAKVCALCDMPAKHPRAEAILEAVYAPLRLLMENNPHAARAVMWYLEKVWRLRPQPHP